jgi:hypothetical protein
MSGIAGRVLADFYTLGLSVLGKESRTLHRSPTIELRCSVFSKAAVYNMIRCLRSHFTCLL